MLELRLRIFDTYLPVGWLRLQENGQGGAGPYSYLILGRALLTYLPRVEYEKARPPGIG